MTEQADGQMTLFDQDTWSGKTFLERSAATKAKISESSSKKQQGLRTVMPLFLDLRMGNGLLREPLWETGGALPGEFSMRSFGESPSVAVESHLSQILEDTPPPRYCLSATACRGILNRAERRGKELPPLLKAALIQQSASKNEPGATGGVKESSYSTTERERSLPSTTSESCKEPILLESNQNHAVIKQDGISTALPASAGMGGGYVPAVCYGISAYESNSMKSGNPHSGIYEAETARTLDGNGGSPACNQGGMAIIEMTSTKNTIVEDGVCPTLTARMGTGGNQVNAVYRIDRAAYNQGINAKYNFRIGDDRKTQTLVAKGPNAVYTASHGCFMTNVSTNVANTLQATDYKDPAFVCPSQSVVRKLTPLECERLQGYPDHWTDIGEWTDSKGKKHKAADSPRYKALGNSIALPPWTYVLTKLNAYCKEHTMASLFDGIGGFPLIWETLNGKGSAVWCSEIEEFPMAVTKMRFPDDG